jgi:hypothetical protein
MPSEASASAGQSRNIGLVTGMGQLVVDSLVETDTI